MSNHTQGDTERSEKTDYGKFAKGAIGQGRPEATCECAYCEGCTLPTYEQESGCVWCRNGEHHYDDAEPERSNHGGEPMSDSTADGCLDCGNQPVVAGGLCSACHEYYKNHVRTLFDYNHPDAGGGQA